MPDFPNFPSLEQFDEDTPKSIEFFSEAIDFEMSAAPKMVSWLEKVIAQENKNFTNINYIFCSDAYLHQINLEYLNHDDFTDIITFPYSETVVNGDIYISIERVRENALLFEVPFEKELQRVMVHGVLHLIGYEDKTHTQKLNMTEKENFYLKWSEVF